MYRGPDGLADCVAEMTAVYKYAAMGGVALALMVGAFLYGLHIGKTAGISVLNETVAKLNQEAVNTLQAALTKQATQDALRLKEDQDAVAQAQAAKQTAQATLQSQAAQIRGLTDVTDKTWLSGRIPAGVLRVLNAPASTGDQGSNGHPNPVHPGSGKSATAVPAWRGLGHTDQC